MYKFSKSSLEKLATCDVKLQHLFMEVIKKVDCIVICGERGEQAQNEAYRNGFSKLKFPNGKHNKHPSLAIDVMPYFKEFPHVRWNDEDACKKFAKIVLNTAEELGIKIRWGGDWNMNGIEDDNWYDRPHFELIK